MKNSKRLFVVGLLSLSGLAFASSPKEDLSVLHQQVKRSLASENIKSVYHYMDLDCEKLMHEKTEDKFLKYLRSNIKLSISDHFCELVELDPVREAHVEYEAQRNYISQADYSNIIDTYYSAYHNR